MEYSIRSLTCSYATAGASFVVRAEDLRLRGGVAYTVTGKNGAGKSLFLRALAQQLGVLEQADVCDVRPCRYVNQEPRQSLFQELTVEENCFLIAHYDRATSLRRPPTLESIFSETESSVVAGLAALRAHRVAQLSGGQRAFVAVIAACLSARKDECVLLDEPTAGLDARHQDQITAFLTKFAKDRQKPVVVATHDDKLVVGLSGENLTIADGIVRIL